MSTLQSTEKWVVHVKFMKCLRSELTVEVLVCFVWCVVFFSPMYFMKQVFLCAFVSEEFDFIVMKL